MKLSASYYLACLNIFLCIYSFSCSITYDYDIILRDGLVIDGTGSPGYNADVGILDGKIKTIGIVSGKAKKELKALKLEEDRLPLILMSDKAITTLIDEGKL